MNYVGGIDDSFARRSRNIDFIALYPLPIHPEGKSAKPAAFLDILGDPSAVGAQGAREVLNESGEKALSRLVCGTLKNRSQSGFFVESTKRRGSVVIVRHLKHLGRNPEHRLTGAAVSNFTNDSRNIRELFAYVKPVGG